MSKIYISGPIIGYVDHNKKAFYDKQNELKKTNKYVSVINPHEVCKSLGNASYGEYMRYDIRALTYCNTIYMLKGWKNSNGAKVEKIVAESMGLEILYE